MEFIGDIGAYGPKELLQFELEKMTPRSFPRGDPGMVGLLKLASLLSRNCLPANLQLGFFKVVKAVVVLCLGLRVILCL